MQKLRTISLFFLFFFLPALLPAQPLPVLPSDPNVTEGRLPNGVSYLIVRDGDMVGSAEAVLLQALARGPETVRFQNLPVHLGKQVLDSLCVRMFNIIGAAVDDDPDNYGTDNQHIIVVGDVKPAELVASLEKHSGTVRESRSANLPPLYKRGPHKFPTLSSRDNGDGTVTLVFRKEKGRIRPDLMRTLVPTVSMQQDATASLVLRKSLGSSLERLGIPFTDLRYTAVPSWKTPGDESYELSVKVNAADEEMTGNAILCLVDQLTAKGLQMNTYLTVRDELTALAVLSSNEPMTAEEQIDRCISHILYGTNMNTKRERLNFYASRDLPDTVQLRGQRRYMEETFGLAAPFETDLEGVRVHTVNKSDTLSFPSPSRKKAKLSKTTTDHVSGGTLWTFDNGMRVVYKQMATDGALYYSMVFGSGAMDAPSAPRESAFYGDLLFAPSIGSSKGSDFRLLCESCGIFMDCDVSLSSLAITGRTRTSRLSLLMKALVMLTTERTPDPKGAAYAIECARLGLTEVDAVGDRLYKRLHPDFAYSPFRTEEGLTETLAEHAEALFQQAFSRANDGVLILIGDRSESEVLKVLRRYVDCFNVSDAKRRPVSPSFRTISGGVTVEEEGRRFSYMQISSSLPFTADNYFTAKVLEVAMNRQFEGLGAKAEIWLSSRPAEHIDIGVYTWSDVTGDDLLDAVLSIEDPGESMKLWKAEAANKDAAARTSPQYWLDVITTRYVEAKDIASSSTAKINSVTPEKLKTLVSKLFDGGCVIYKSE